MSGNKAIWWVYILRCQGDVFYTGITTNLAQRFRVHQQGKGAKFTRAHRPLEIWCHFGPYTKSQALREEYRIKQLPHSAKEALKLSCP
ncbi:GIY-YIG nuclease family protein [Sulfobacillus thermosulfidooxidans]|uniref:GIY-YIG nuclease family protein n=2 Tax=Sulfobacillus thermosulfidooxidans TaxID=28034 RepID=A0A1R0IVA3_SULTH|nr:GIY-YIG nuclease family protein [Sulfobacillus thermosulfidooxidans]OLZ11964.1 hypothetical protein BFX05_05675 [Sulfobacillus thermosulfidooxidans]OLZ17647.1 hypothetical protein BFX06_12920 [Sulfobacillus thermosulfidooxidans]OLZ22428.1 hypothetical protein BFX07_00290 [Sulfobacillus thermosulfidooxidans]PSR28780.1 MAG: GIY-YIG nuclease family protein [Sulfobacillus thermosulfidooxidans]SMC03274.1 putative endonuclease [Sulfobacillus thermosulfidooxidans DSM 9293]